MTIEFTSAEVATITKRLARYAITANDVKFYWTDFWLSGTNGMFKPDEVKMVL